MYDFPGYDSGAADHAADDQFLLGGYAGLCIMNSHLMKDISQPAGWRDVLYIGQKRLK
jgi:hypothetical protein